MSAYIVDHKTIDRIVTFLLDNVREFGGLSLSTVHPDGTATTIGQQLYRLNTDAVNQRYHERTESPGLTYKFKPASKRSDIQAYKSISCFLYQCSEGDVPERPLFKELSRIHDELAHRIVASSAPYDRAEWG